jgi:acyl-CoA synthetase (AMP-forming)/AMP-acid ligase II
MPEPHLIHDFLEGSARRYPDKVALVHEETRATYAEINARANRLAHWLLARGARTGDRVVLLLENSLGYVVSYYGSLKAGAVSVPLSSDLKPESLQPLLDELKPGVVISSFRFERLLRAVDLVRTGVHTLLLHAPRLSWSGAPYAVHAWEDVVEDGDVTNPDRQIQEGMLASIIYTSGSTGKPKGVMLSHRNIVANTDSICQYLELTAADVQMVILPFFYVMGKSLLNSHFAAGGSVVINNKFAFPASVLGQMVEEKITGFSGVPSTYAYLLHRSPLAKYRDKLPRLRYCSQAGGHMSLAVKQELRRVLPSHTRIYIMYGATEAAARLSYLEPAAFARKMDSIGKAIPGVTLAVLDAQGQELPPGRQGELVASGANIMLGYWQDPEATGRALDDRGYHTGDLAYRDDDGYFYVVGRNDDLLKVGGHRINPKEIEDALMESGLLVEAVIQAVPDPLLGHKLVAVAVARTDGCPENEILQHCAERLPRPKVPSRVVLVRTLPKAPSGKIDRARCKELLRQTDGNGSGEVSG